MLLLTLIASGAQAQAVVTGLADHGIHEVHYEAPQGCPDRNDFVRRARQHLASVQGKLPARRELHVRLRSSKRGARGELTLSAAGRVTARRTLEAADCLQAADALALILAITLEPPESTADRVPPAAPRPDPPRAAPPAVRAPPPVVKADAEVPEQPASSQARALTAPTLPTRVDPPRERVSGRPGQSPFRLALRASGGAVSGVLPSWRPLFTAALIASWRLPVALGVSLRAGVRLAPGESVETDAGRADFRWWTSDVSACLGWLPGGPVDLHACADAEVGRLTVHGRDTRNPRRSGRPWTALGPGFVVGWRLFPPLSVQLAGGALWPFTRDRYLLADELVHRPARVGARLELGVEVSFP